MAGNYAEIIQVFLVVFAMMAELLIFCWLGNELTEQVIALKLNCL
jgi:preprotein translocase subunit SecE